MQPASMTTSRHARAGTKVARDPRAARRLAGCLSIAALLVAAPATVSASLGLRGTMHEWRANARHLYDMAIGRAAFDPAEVDHALHAYDAEAERIAARIDTGSARARDFREHFVTFAADARSTRADAAERPRLAADLRHLFGDCRSCHDKYNN